MSEKTIIFVHGGCHGAWCWENYESYFSKLGYHTIALNLPGHEPNKPRSKATANKYFETIDNAVESARKNSSSEIILIGHSIGGIITQKYLALYPNKVDQAVLLATAPAKNSGAFLWSVTKRLVKKPSEIMPLFRVLSLVLVKPKDTERLRKSAFCSSRITSEMAKKYSPMLCPEPFGAVFGVLFLHADLSAIKTPVVLVVSTGDGIVSPKEGQAISDIYGTKQVVVDGLCHDMMIDPEWRKSADAVKTIISGK